MTDAELTFRVWWQKGQLEAAVPAWKDRVYEASKYAGRDKAAFEAKVGQRRSRSLFKTLEALESAMFRIKPDWSNDATLSDVAMQMEAVLRGRFAGIPDKVMSELINRYMFSYR
ncbi:hypothetical protein [Pararhodobacter oceanensis]|uniref:Uncharacterized protein n=1 Tax=Pararhodobacter oceanensis TaxID=2172121 RepID=A0A2T8HVK4_9RHOB|nr:hypothetical protein [Pararhodobacter oceanensis]PVH29456.1 hypothetical protein DDE20_04795 [Pararhodobacter oceanensis]